MPSLRLAEVLWIGIISRMPETWNGKRGIRSGIISLRVPVRWCALGLGTFADLTGDGLMEVLFVCDSHRHCVDSGP